MNSKLLYKSFLIFLSLLLANGCNSSDDKEKTKPAANTTQAKEQTGQQDLSPEFVPCHSLDADLSPDGNVFASLIQEGTVLSVSNFKDKNKQSELKLPRPAQDVILLDDENAILSFHTTGEIVPVDLENGKMGEAVKIGKSASGMCRVSENKFLIADPASGHIHLFSSGSGSVEQSFPVEGTPELMRWVIRDYKVEVADAKSNSIGTIVIAEINTEKAESGFKENR